MILVVTILGILAAVVIPLINNAGTDAKTSSARANLAEMRSQIQLYNNREGGFPANLSALVSQEYLREVPDEPFGGSWNYIAAQGVVTSSTNPSW